MDSFSNASGDEGNILIIYEKLAYLSFLLGIFNFFTILYKMHFSARPLFQGERVLDNLNMAISRISLYT